MKNENQWSRIAAEDILWIEAAREFSHVHTKVQTLAVRQTLRQLETLLDSSCFLRVNRFCIVNIQTIISLRHTSNHEYMITLETGAMMKVGRKYKMKLDELNDNNQQGLVGLN